MTTKEIRFYLLAVFLITAGWLLYGETKPRCVEVLTINIYSEPRRQEFAVVRIDQIQSIKKVFDESMGVDFVYMSLINRSEPLVIKAEDYEQMRSILR